MRTRKLIGTMLAAPAALAIIAAPTAAADPQEIANDPTCTSAGLGGTTGTGITQCQTPGNVQISAQAPDVPTWSYPWDDEFYGPALIIGGGPVR
ncbi:hypothetical protein [Mycolicibacterium sp. 050158]|uniref:hypothetical protein n=1 Tax=Mycolicibacterium sp. 050158 TaxID=3090602 RepID=UPI00299E6CE3|nr:hypothetical protein [Mycolicibacterium sp. 050158]MDX1890245.1 hypothetical protein [Mycolicibacterium sp. 050158]